MKNLKYFVTILLSVLLLVLACGCTRVAPLDTPKGFNFDERLNLYWTYVPGARSYIVDIKGDNGYRQEMTPHVTHVSLEYLTEGDYEIKVKAIGGSNNEASSAWSKVIDFRREKESGVLFTAINGSTEYAVSAIGSATGKVIIEDVYRGKPVTEIAEDAFRGKGNSRLESVTVGANVRTIGSNAFYNCTNLQEVVFPESLTSIGTNLFQGCSNLKSVTFPAGVTSIPSYTFAYCRALEEFTIGETVTSIGESAFYNCSALKSIVIPDSVTYIGPYAFDSNIALESVSFGSGISTISGYAFYNCTGLTELTFRKVESLSLSDRAFEGSSALETIELPEGLTSIGAYTFYRCSALEDIKIPDTVTSIGVFAFRDTALFYEQGELRDDGYVYTTAGHDGFIYADNWIVAATDEFKLNVTTLDSNSMRAGVVGIADQTFVVNVVSDTGSIQTVGAPKLTEVNLASSVKYIGVYAFYKCQLLNKFTTATGSQLIAIADRAFQECPLLNTVSFKNSSNLRDIGSYAFYECIALVDNGTNLVPNSVERIGTYAFYNTALWDGAALEGGIVYAGNWVVGYNNLEDTAVKLSDSLVGIADFAFYQNTEIQTLEGLSKAKFIGRGAFFGCSSLNQISLNASLIEIADNTFSGCSSLFIVSFPYRLKRIGLRAFYECTLLDAIDLSETAVTEIGAAAFYGCYNVKSIKLGEQLEYIGDTAFYGIRQVEELTIPNKVKEIGMHAFANCEALETIHFGSGLEIIGAGAFQNSQVLQSITMGDGLKSIGSYAFYMCPALTNVDLGNGIEEIGNYVFAATSIKSISLPASLKIIGDYAFKNCKQLTSVIMHGLPEYIGVHAFYGNNALTIYALGEGAASDWNSRWNSSYRPIIWSCTLSEDGDYIASFTTSFETISNPFARGGFSAPTREGYDFVGWALTPGGDVKYGADDWRNAPFGTTLYSVWTEHVDAPMEDLEETDPA